MCGIVGTLAARAADVGAVARARDALAHRGPDHAGLWTSPDSRVALGHRRLAIIAPTADGNQPFVTADGRFAITFNGEIYNYRELRRELTASGARFRTATDTEVLVEAYRRWGADCLARLSGMFAFGIWDRDERTLLLARDRAGEKPLYYATVGDDFVFGSELKAIAGWPGFRRRLDPTALADFLTFGFVPDPKAIWEGCRKLPPAHWMRLTLEPGAPPRVTQPPVAYWDWSPRPDHDVSDWGDELRATLERSAAEMAVSDVPLGTFLSGGVDSSGVTAALCRAGLDVRTFTVGFDESGYDERSYAAMVAERYHTRHSARTVSADDVTTVLDDLLWHYDEPFNDYSYLPTYYLCRDARRDITVALSGDGGDELLAGYRKYQRLGLRDDVRRVLPPPLVPMLAVASRRFGGGTRLARAVTQYTVPAPSALGDMLTLGFQPRTLAPSTRGVLSSVLADYSPYEVVAGHLTNAPPDEVGMVNAMRYLDLKLTLAGGILVKVDRASMAVSLEVRPVFLHRDLMALAARIPASALAGRNRSKEALKRALRPWLPDAVLFRRKQGFALPLGEWIRRGWTEIGNASSARRGAGRLKALIDPALLKRLVTEHRSGAGSHTATVHSLMLLERWLERWDAEIPTA